MDTQLTPFDPPLGPQPRRAPIYSDQQVTLQMKEKVISWSGDDFSINTIDGVPIAVCKGTVFSAHQKKAFTLPPGSGGKGEELFTLQKARVVELIKSFDGKSPSGQHDFKVKGHFGIGKSKSTCTFKNASDGRDISLEMKGDWLSRKAEITMTDGRPVAAIHRKILNARELLGGEQTYFVTVAPNVDLSLIAALCVSLDERKNDSNGGAA